MKLLEITSRCYFTEVTRKSHRVAISSKYSKSHRVAISMKLLEKTSRCYFTEVTRKSHRVAILKRLLENHIALLFHRSYSKSLRVAISNQSGRLLLVLTFDRIKIFEFSALFPAISRLFKRKCSRDLFNFNSATF